MKWEDLAMSGIKLLRSLVGASLAFVMGAATAADAQTTALRGARVIDGSGGAAIDNAVIVIRDGHIVAIGPSAGTPVPSDAEVVDYTGKTIIPGLISDHSHVGTL
jgi:imidazolonepropionase-like amidohydrolase